MIKVTKSKFHFTINRRVSTKNKQVYKEGRCVRMRKYRVPDIRIEFTLFGKSLIWFSSRRVASNWIRLGSGRFESVRIVSSRIGSVQIVTNRIWSAWIGFLYTSDKELVYTGIINDKKRKIKKKRKIQMQAQGNVTNYIKVPSFSYACSNPCITLVSKKVSLKDKEWSFE